MTNTVNLTPEQVEDVCQVVQEYFRQLGLNDDTCVSGALGIDLRDGPTVEHAENAKRFGRDLLLSARLLSDALEAGVLALDDPAFELIVRVQRRAERTLDEDRGTCAGGEEDPEGVRLAALELARACSLRELFPNPRKTLVMV